ncbi:S-adenosylmethionine:tRNA ribosyltransferase-isomerase [Entomortierella parvispora]|uniref:S-adenosylmethionine:tRNA ribosyltransferase-isomerase n=1 Tax=Entomortierella parvispora TaxID=205924 RepID=A0A9P3LR52_9FUNG|nr:S-adenosylmethionine:tRNA ribosyltransferase-isomerase [Entomortierella parvispora]
MKTEEFQFKLDARTMPADPVELRGKSRDSGKMIILDRSAATIEHSEFPSICDHLQSGDLLVLNDSYMLSNTLSFRHGEELVKITLYGHEPDESSIVFIASGHKMSLGLTLTSSDDDQLTCVFIAPLPDQLWQVKFSSAERLMETLDKFGLRCDETIHLNPTYWRTAPEAYRSVYAKKPGSLEIPSAGLHFSSELLARIADKGVEIANITLHVGATEILAVRHISEEEIENHKVRSEYFEVSAESAAQISKAMDENRRVVAVGTTVMRTLESLALHNSPKVTVQAQAGWTDLYIYPGFQFKVVNALLTNLHRPRSSHIVLTAAFAGKDLVMRSYAEILDRGGYEFDMFGDSMLIV